MHKIFDSIWRILAIFVLIATLYIVFVFLFPDFMDRYTNAQINSQIRNIKETSFHISSPSGNLNLPF